MARLTKFSTLLFSFYFVVFSMLPQNYTFMNKVLSYLEMQLFSEQSVPDVENTAEEDGKPDKKPQTLVEEDLFHCEAEKTSFYADKKNPRYYHTNESCKGISPDTSLPPPDLLTV